MTFFKINKLFNTRYIVLFLAFILGLFMFADISFAAETAPSGDLKQNETVKLIIDVLTGITKIGAALLGVITAFVSLFLHPSWVNGEMFGLNTSLKTIWILISNVVYFLFAIVLIWIAFQNIIGQGTGKYELKQAIPKFIVGVLIVPFSWFFIQFVLSISAVLTVAVLSLPFDTFKNSDFFKSGLDKVKVCTKYEIDMGSQPTGTPDSQYDLGFIKCKDPSAIKPLKVVLNGGETSAGGTPGVKDGIFGIVSIYTYGVMNIESLPKINGDQIKDIKSIFNLGEKVLFDFMFFFAYLLLMISLFMALFVRGIRLWLYAMLSPVFGLMYFFGKNDADADGKFTFKGFISLAMVPVLVSAAFSFGLVFLFIVGEGITKNSQNNTPGDGAMLHKCGNNSTSECLDFGGFSLQVNGALGGGEKNSSGSSSGMNLTDVGGFFGHMIMALFGIAILWIAVKSALESSKVTGAIVKPIMDFGSSVGSLVMSAPKYAPIIPTSGGAPKSLSSVMNTGTSAVQSINNSLGNEGRNEGNSLADTIMGKVDTSELRDTIRKQTQIATKDAQSIKDTLGQFISKLDDKTLGDANVRNQVSEYLTKIEAPKNLIDGLKDGKIDTKDKLEREMRNTKNENWGNGTFKSGEVEEMIKLIGTGVVGNTNTTQNITINGLPSGKSIDITKGEQGTAKYKNVGFIANDNVDKMVNEFNINEFKNALNDDNITTDDDKKKIIEEILKTIGITNTSKINTFRDSIITKLNSTSGSSSTTPPPIGSAS